MNSLILGFLLIIQPQADLRRERVAELQKIVPTITNAVLQGKPDDLIALLSYDIVVDTEVVMKTAALESDLKTRGPIYCRIFNTACARQPSVRDLLGNAPRGEITFFIPESTGREDYEFAYITYAGATAAWRAGIFVGLERIGGRWRICALFPRTY